MSGQSILCFSRLVTDGIATTLREKFGAKVVRVGTLREALLTLADTQPAAIIVDDWIQYGHGTDFCRQLRANSRWRDTHLIIYSFTEPTAHEQAETCGGKVILRGDGRRQELIKYLRQSLHLKTVPNYRAGQSERRTLLECQREQRRLAVTAYHEAGHAVAAYILKLKFAEQGYAISIIPEGDGAGHVNIPIRRYRNRQSAEKLVQCLLAGMEAQRRFNPRSTRYSHGLSDFCIARELLKPWASAKKELFACLHVIGAGTRTIISENWSLVEAVADVLIRKRQITAAEAVTVMRLVKRSARRKAKG